jgi:hypothetical protein
MNDSIRFEDKAGCSMVRPRGSHDQLNPRGRFHVEHWRDGKKIGDYELLNTVTNEGKNALLNVQFNGATAIGTWYIALVDGSGTPVLAATDIYAHISNGNGWNENALYSNGTRPAWGPGASSGQSVTNASPAVFNMNGSGSVYGMALVGGGSAPSTINDHAGGGVLWAAAPFQSGVVTVANGDQLKVTYTLSC